MNSYLLSHLVIFLIGLFSSLLCLFYLQRIESTKLRCSAQFWILSLLIYSTLISAVRLPNLSYDTAHILSHLIFFFIHVHMLIMIIFMIIFLKIPEEARTIRFSTIVAIDVVLMIMSPLEGYLEAGLKQVDSQYQPISGAWRPLSQFFYVLFFFYSGYLFIRTYRQTKDSFTQRQIVLVGVTIIVCAAGSLICNALIPLYLGVSHYNILSQLFYILLIYTCFYLNVQYRNSHIIYILKSMLKLFPFKTSFSNVIVLQQLLHSVITALGQKPQKMAECFSFELELEEGAKGKPKQKRLYLSTDLPQALKQDNDIRTYFPIRSYLEALNRLERENLALGLNLQLSHEMLNDCVSLKKLLEYEKARNNVEDTLSLIDNKDHLNPLEHSEKREILKSLTKHHYNKAIAAKELGITLNTIKGKIKKYNIELKPLPVKQIQLLLE